MTSVRFLRVLLAASLIALISYLSALSWVSWQARGALADGDTARADLVRLAEARHQLAVADVAAATWFSQPTSSSKRSEATDALDSALADISATASSQTTAKATVHQRVLSYAMALQRGFEATGTEAGTRLLAAHKLLASDVDDALDALVAEREQALAATTGTSMLLVIHGGGLLAALILVAASILLARRVHRAVNIGLVVALVAVIGSWLLALGTLSSGEADSVAVGALRASGAAQGAGTRAQSPLLIAVASPALVSKASDSFAADIAKARKSVEGKDDLADLSTVIESLAEQGGKALAAVKGGQNTQAKAPLDGAQGQVKLLTTTVDTLQTNSVNTLSEPAARAADLVLTALWLLPLIGAIAAALLVIGVNQRLREFR